MDPSDSEINRDAAEKEKQSETPTSRGTRHRKKNSKYADYETDIVCDGSKQEKAAEASEEGKPTSPLQTPKRRRRSSKHVSAPSVDADEPPKSEEPAVKAPARGRKKKTPAKKRQSASKSPSKPPEGGAAAAGDAEQLENGTPKPKRKYVKRQRFYLEPLDDPKEKEPERTEHQEGIEPGGRPRRGAAKAALQYLQSLAQEVFAASKEEPEVQAGGKDDDADDGAEKKRQRRRRKRRNSSGAEDEDFLPDVGEDEAEEMEEEEDEMEERSDSECTTRYKAPAFHRVFNNNKSSFVNPENGLPGNVINTVWQSAETTRKFRQQHHSSWVFPQWLPSSTDWIPVPQSELDQYLPQELQSAAFTVTRDGIKNQEPPQRLSRFQSSSPHSERWDSFLFTGGPVWALEWCPTPDGTSNSTQYVALASHRGMDDQHQVQISQTGASLVQLWDVGPLPYGSRPVSQPTLCYGLALDAGAVWQLKFCPAGCWEPPDSVTTPPSLSRLGLLAVATTNAVVTVYSLPHPGTLPTAGTPPLDPGSDVINPAIYKVHSVVRLQLGSFKAPRHDNSGKVLSIDWLPLKPHDVIAVGFYDGNVGLWNLTTRSALLRVRHPGESMVLLPYRCFLAHQHAVRAVSFCPASRSLLVTAGDDRLVKMWDLRRIWDPVCVTKKNLTNEVCWPLNAPGLMLAQETAFVSRGSHGLQYMDDHCVRSIMLIPRTATMWSISYSDWLHIAVTSDTLGEMVLTLLPQVDQSHPHIRRAIDRRFPVFFTSLVPSDTTEEEEGGEEEEGDQDKEGKRKQPRLHFQTYKEAARKYVLHFTDNNMRSFVGAQRRSVWKRMKNTETKTKIGLDDMPLAALHKVRFNPNLSSHTWAASAGQAGLVRLTCLSGLVNSHLKKMLDDHFKVPYVAPCRQEEEELQPDDQPL